jgi:hypothetical protein
MAVDTMFQPSGGAGGGSSGDYVKDHFQDTSREATNNDTLTSSASVNPLGFYFNNNDTPQYGLKTLYIKDLALIEDRTKWVSDKPTYEISFTEYNPAVKAYAVGNVRLRQSTKGKVLELRSVDDIIGVTGVVRQVGWIAQPSLESTASADTITDGVAVSTINFQSLAADANQGTTKFNVYLHNSSPATNDIHDYRLEANQAGGTLDIAGILVYFDGANVVFRPGQTYNDKVLVTTTLGATAAPASISGRLGANTVISKSAVGAYVQSSQEPENLSTIGVGLSGTNLVDVTTGSGASFGLGYGVAAIAGTSNYFGIVQNISTDTLTVGPTLSFGLSGVLYKLFAAGPTYVISPSLYKISESLDPFQLNNTIQSGVFGATLQGEMYFADAQGKYNVFGKDLQFQSFDGRIGLGFEGNTSAFLQVDGKFAAAEIEFAANGIFNGTFAINGVPAWSINSGFSGVFKKTVFAAGGPGWNSFVFSPGQSHIGCPITKINLYELRYPIGVTAGVLSSYESFADGVNRGGVQNATIMQLGAMQRIYADKLFLQGAWTRGVTHTAAGGVYYGGASTNSVLKFQYFGKDFGLVGTVGGSMTLTLDGASIGTNFNTLKSVPSMTWHTVELTYRAGDTCVIHAVDYIPPSQMELKSLQKTQPLSSTSKIPEIYIQSDTPQKAKDMDIWVQQKQTVSAANTRAWIKLFGLWNRIQFDVTIDDPQMTQAIRVGGSTDNTTTNVSSNTESYNGVAWLSHAQTPTACGYGTNADIGFDYGVNVVDRTSGTVQALHIRFNLIAWATLTNRGTARSKGSAADFFGQLWVNKGSIDGTDGNAANAQNIWSGTAWANGTNYATSAWKVGAFVINSLMSCVAGVNSAGSNTTLHETKTSTDTLGSQTAFPISSNGTCASTLVTMGFIAFSGNSNPNALNYAWNGSAWTQTASVSYSSTNGDTGGGANILGNVGFAAGGLNGTTALANTSRFNLIAWAVDNSAPGARANYNMGTYGR